MIADGGAWSERAARPIPRWELAAYGALLAYFAARVVFLAVRLHTFVPPDEVTHMGRVLAYAGTWGVPDEGPATYEFGLVGHRPWLYYWLMARVLALYHLTVGSAVACELEAGCEIDASGGRKISRSNSVIS